MSPLPDVLCKIKRRDPGGTEALGLQNAAEQPHPSQESTSCEAHVRREREAVVCFALVRFAVLIWIASLGLAAEVAEPKLRRELLRREAKDQAARERTLEFLERHGRDLHKERSISNTDLPAQISKAYVRLIHKVMSVDRGNQVWLACVLDRYGWPGSSLVGKDGADAAWLIAQHADRDIGFQRRCAEMMAGMPLNDVDQDSMANLTDRNAVNARRNQIYGTQWEPRDGRLVPSIPIDDEPNVDARRTSRGLKPLRDYLAEKKAGFAWTDR